MNFEYGDLNLQFYVDFQFNHEFSLSKLIEIQALFFDAISRFRDDKLF